jgi:hypothetical protein
VGKAWIPVIAPAMAMAMMVTGCARVYTLRATAGIERTSGGAEGAQVLFTFGMPIEITPKHHVMVTTRAGLTRPGDPPLTMGVGLEWLLAWGRAIVRLGPDYLTRREVDSSAVAYNAVGLRAGLLFAFGISTGRSEPGILGALFDDDDDDGPYGLGYGTDGGQASSTPEQDVTRRHGVGIEAHGGIMFGGEVVERGLGYLGLAYEYAVLSRE